MAYYQKPGRGKSTPLKMAGEKMKSTNPIMMKGDLDKDGKLSGYEAKRQSAIDKAMADEKSPVKMYGSPAKMEGDKGPLKMYKSPVKMNGGPGDDDEDEKKEETVKVAGTEFEKKAAEKIFTTNPSIEIYGGETTKVLTEKEVRAKNLMKRFKAGLISEEQFNKMMQRNK